MPHKSTKKTKEDAPLRKTVKLTGRKKPVASRSQRKVVWHSGVPTATTGGLRRADLEKKNGRLVSKKASAASKKKYPHIKKWVDSVKKAKKELGHDRLKEFQAVGGKSSNGKAIYAKAKSIYYA